MGPRAGTIFARSQRGTDNASILTENSGLSLTIRHLVSCLKSQKTNRDQPVNAPSVGAGRTMDISDHRGLSHLRVFYHCLFRCFQSCCYCSLLSTSLDFTCQKAREPVCFGLKSCDTPHSYSRLAHMFTLQSGFPK